jgi:glyoxylase I family protein
MSVPAAGDVLSGAVAHIDLVIGDLDRSLAFYLGLLAPLGWRTHGTIEGERGERVVYLQSADRTQLGLRERPGSADPGQAPDRYEIGLHHLAFRAGSREAVIERGRWLREQGATLESAPAEREYAPGYFALFVLDPDGLKLEIVHLPPTRSDFERATARRGPEAADG